MGAFSSRIARKEGVERLDADKALAIGRQPRIVADRWQLLVSLPWDILGIKPDFHRPECFGELILQ